uniref:Uncharacterized protein n=1 Tax=Fagus sylvatica TaxID=28930 RepID=A0A2N9I187_FAGSY
MKEVAKKGKKRKEKSNSEHEKFWGFSVAGVVVVIRWWLGLAGVVFWVFCLSTKPVDSAWAWRSGLIRLGLADLG